MYPAFARGILHTGRLVLYNGGSYQKHRIEPDKDGVWRNTFPKTR